MKKNHIKIFILLTFFTFYGFAGNLEENNYWNITGRNSIVWDTGKASGLPHSDNIEMAGEKVAAILYYTINESQQLELSRDIIFPQLRTFNKTNEPDWKKHRAYFRQTFGNEILPNLSHNGKILVPDKVDSVEIAGKIIFYHHPVQGIKITRTLLPSMKERLFIEKWELTNLTGEQQTLSVGNTNYTSSQAGYKGIYHVHLYTDAENEIQLAPGATHSFALFFSAGINNEALEGFDLTTEETGRNQFLQEMRTNLVLQTSNDVLNTLFYFSKIRAAENIFSSKMGIVHSPGGGNYYVGVWANDQVEYSGPFFPFLGYPKGNRAAFNAYKMFQNNIPENFTPISSSFEIDGELPCCGKDRGDAAMIAYGTSQYLLMTGDKEKSEELWPLIEWSLEYCKRQINEDGVVTSETDEMEGRISTGDANLATSSLYYGGLKFASFLAKELGLDEKAAVYKNRKNDIAKAIENHFGYTLEGLETYRYFDGNQHLRHWICLPLVMGINNRAEATTEALLHKLWTENGVLVELNPESKSADVFWDRGTLYALRGTFKAGAVDESFEKLTAFSEKRLLGDHVPYVIEAYPENNMRHLSAESALYCRIFTEGLLGFEQTGFHSFEITPQLPKELNSFKLSGIHMNDTEFTIEMQRTQNNKIDLKVYTPEKMLVSKNSTPREKVSVHF